MRFSAEDRRLLARRFKNRLPAIFGRARLRRLPQLMLIISATVFLTPEAKAKIEANEATPVFTKTYSKDELQKTMPANPVTNLGDRIIAEVGEIFRTVTAAQGGTNQRNQIEGLKTKQADKATWGMAAARMKDAPTTPKASIDNFRSYLAGETKKATSKRASTRFPIVEKLKSGFSMNLSSYFSKAQEPASGNVRYGLVLADIKPATDAYDRASMADSGDEMQFAGHADVQWTIGALDEEQGRRLFAFDEASSKTSDSDSLWSRVRVPKFKFNSKFKPESVDTFALLSSDTMPVWRFDLAQEDGLFNLVYRTKANGQRVSQEETVTLPLVGNTSIGRRFSDKWEAIQTSAYNILFDKRMPLVSVHYMHIEERFKGDISKQLDPHTRIAVGGKGRATGAVLENGEGDRPEQYSLEYVKAF